jgi:hypothetical protein
MQAFSLFPHGPFSQQRPVQSQRQGAERLCDLLTICKAAAFKAALFVLMDKQQMDSEGFKK